MRHAKLFGCLLGVVVAVAATEQSDELSDERIFGWSLRFPPPTPPPTIRNAPAPSVLHAASGSQCADKYGSANHAIEKDDRIRILVHVDANEKCEKSI